MKNKKLATIGLVPGLFLANAQAVEWDETPYETKHRELIECLAEASGVAEPNICAGFSNTIEVQSEKKYFNNSQLKSTLFTIGKKGITEDLAGFDVKFDDADVQGTWDCSEVASHARDIVFRDDRNSITKINCIGTLTEPQPSSKSHINNQLNGSTISYSDGYVEKKSIVHDPYPTAAQLNEFNTNDANGDKWDDNHCLMVDWNNRSTTIYRNSRVGCIYNGRSYNSKGDSYWTVSDNYAKQIQKYWDYLDSADYVEPGREGEYLYRYTSVVDINVKNEVEKASSQSFEPTITKKVHRKFVQAGKEETVMVPVMVGDITTIFPVSVEPWVELTELGSQITKPTYNRDIFASQKIVYGCDALGNNPKDEVETILPLEQISSYNFDYDDGRSGTFTRSLVSKCDVATVKIEGLTVTGDDSLGMELVIRPYDDTQTAIQVWKTYADMVLIKLKQVKALESDLNKVTNNNGESLSDIRASISARFNAEHYADIISYLKRQGKTEHQAELAYDDFIVSSSDGNTFLLQVTTENALYDISWWQGYINSRAFQNSEGETINPKKDESDNLIRVYELTNSGTVTTSDQLSTLINSYLPKEIKRAQAFLSKVTELKENLDTDIDSDLDDLLKKIRNEL